MTLLVSGVLGGVVYGAILALVTAGMTLIYRVSGVANFAHGSLMALAMYLALDLHRALGWDPLVLGILLAPLMGAVGACVYWGGVHRLRRRHHLLPVQFLLGLALVIEALLLLRYGGDVQSLENAFSSRRVDILGTGFQMVRVVAAIFSVVVLGVVALAIQRTSWGRRLRAAAADELAATLAAISVPKVEAWTWAVAVGMLGAVAAPLGSAFPITPDMGLSYTVLGLVVMIVGGSGSLGGTVCAGILVGVVQNVGLIYLPGSYGGLLPYALLVGVLVFRPGGLESLMRRRPALP